MKRIAAITEALDSKGIDAILVTDNRNIRYLTGFSGSFGCLIITKKDRVFCTDSRYAEQARRQITGFDVMIVSDERNKALIEKAKTLGIRTLGFESTITYAFYKSLLRKGVRLKAVSNFVEDMRKIKDAAELRFIEKAVEQAEQAFFEIKPYIKKDVSEKKIATMLEDSIKKRGCSALPFDIIVAAGQNSAMPHARPTDNKIKTGDLVLIDWGGEAGGYFSDMTRTFLVKGDNISKKQEIYKTVLLANRAAINSIAESRQAKTVDRTARDIIKNAGYDNYFGHGTGHGVGIDIHELPHISRTGSESIKTGMVFTVEPGIYIPGLGGVRIEDMIAIDKGGCRVLTTIPKELEIIG
jgi:Xaa-Pro aminopeptidase